MVQGQPGVGEDVCKTPSYKHAECSGACLLSSHVGGIGRRTVV
jgi:hypothetical protein